MATVAVSVVASATWLLTVAWLSAHARVDAPGPASVDELLALGAATAAVGIAAWLCLGTALEVLAHVPGRVGRLAGDWADRLTPAVARRTATFLLGVGVGVAGGPSQAVAGPTSSVAAGATAKTADDGASPNLPNAPADPGFLATPVPPDAGFTPIPAGPGFTPTAPRVRPQADPRLLGARPVPDNAHEVVVHRGDSLWSLAARHLGPDAGDAEVAQAWPLWFEANRDRIGDDPDLILPGQSLRIPDLARTEGSRAR